MIKLADKYHCTGCSACSNICPKQAIDMKPDIEGFLQPIINQEKCIECGLCVKHCPVINPISTKELKQEVYAMISNKDRNVSSSGGAFSVFARIILSKGGSVYGATINKELHVHHIRIDNIEDLSLLRGSKYVQSEIGNCFQLAKKDLQNGQMVLFTGTPCQIAGLYKYLGKKYENLLITLDLVCHGVPSQGVFNEYIKKLENTITNGKKIQEFRFRKFNSWSIVPAIKFTKSKWRKLNLWENAYMNAFFEGYIFRESCFRCQYCSTNRVGIFTIADFWGIGRHGFPFKKNIACGVSLVIDNYNSMPILKESILQEAYIEKRTIEEAIAEQTNLKHPLLRQPQRDKAINLLMNPNTTLKEFSKACNLPWKVTFKYLVIKILKDLIYTLGLYNIYKTINYKIKKS